MTDTALAIATNPHDWQIMKEQTAVLIKSGFLPPSIKTEAQALSVALAGRELGIGLMESMRSINVIQGKPTISPQLMLALANRTKELEDLKINATDDGADVSIKRKGRNVHTSSFGPKEASDLGLMSKDNYKKQPKTMFIWRALAANLRVTFPDVVLGMYTAEEMGATVVMGEGGEIIDVKTEEIPESNPIETEAPKERTKVQRIHDLIGLMCAGDLPKMESMLRDITKWNKKDKSGAYTGDVGFLTFDSLPRYAEMRPSWIDKILETVKTQFDAFSQDKKNTVKTS